MNEQLVDWKLARQFVVEGLSICGWLGALVDTRDLADRYSLSTYGAGPVGQRNLAEGGFSSSRGAFSWLADKLRGVRANHPDVTLLVYRSFLLAPSPGGPGTKGARFTDSAFEVPFSGDDQLISDLMRSRSASRFLAVTADLEDDVGPRTLKVRAFALGAFDMETFLFAEQLEK